MESHKRKYQFGRETTPAACRIPEPEAQGVRSPPGTGGNRKRETTALSLRGKREKGRKEKERSYGGAVRETVSVTPLEFQGVVVK